MATNARWTAAPDLSSNSGSSFAGSLTTAAADYTGVSANNKTVFTSQAVAPGSRIVGLHFQAAGTNVQSVARIYVNNGSDPTVAANNMLVAAVTLPATGASNTVAEQPVDYVFPGGFLDLNPNFRVLVGLATTVAAGWVVSPILGADY